jgi:uncharacterized protein YbjT (DUF2867 family)
MVGMTHHMHPTDPVPTTLVLGGTGKTGRRVVERLEARGLPTRVGSRSGEPPFDWEDRATWAPALHDVQAAYVSFHPDLAVPGAAETVAALADLAVAQGVRRLVLLSGRGEPEAQRSERLLQTAGAEWTILRASWFSQNFSENFLLEDVLGGEVALPVDEVREPFVDAEDIADAAVAALTEDGHEGRLYELTGPRLLTFAEAVAEIAEASRRDIRFRAVPMGQYSSALAEQGIPAEVASLVSYLFSEVLDGRNQSLSDGVQRALGRPPRDFRDYARETAAAGIWSSGSTTTDELAGARR